MTAPCRCPSARSSGVCFQSSRIARSAAFWSSTPQIPRLNRVASNLIIRDEDGTAIEDLLESHVGDLLDLNVTLGKEKHQARLVAIRASKAGAERARGRTLGKAQRLRCQWHLVATNITAEQPGARDINELYRCRWNIGIIFRAWKQSANLDKALDRQSNEDHFQVLMLAGMIYQVMSLSVLSFMRQMIIKKRISYEKTSIILATGSSDRGT